MEVWEDIRDDAEKGARRLVAEYWERLFGASLALCKEEHSAEDLVFRTFAQACMKISQYNPALPFWNWLYAILLNYFRGDLRKMRAEVAETADFVELSSEYWGEGGANAQPLSALDAAMVRRAVSRLPSALRETVVLFYFEEKSLGDMAALMSVPVGTVKSRLFAARRALRRSLSEVFRERGKK